MKIGYFVPPTLLRHAGIRSRVEGTLGAWHRLGHEGILLECGERTSGPLPARHLLGDADSARLAAGLIRDGELDHVHLRLFLPTRRWRTVAREVPLSVEVHAGLRRAESARDFARVVLGARSARSVVRGAVGGAFVTRELSELPEYSSLGARIAIGNGVRLTPAQPAPANARPRVGMAVGSANAWHGLDRFARLASRVASCEFLVIAPGRIADYVARSLAGTAVSARITSDSSDYEDALGGLDVAVGSLAVERAGLTEAAPLKVRDYVNVGIPTALPYLDTNLSGLDDPALFRLTAGTPDSVFREWVFRMVGERVAESTREAISIDTIERRRLTIMDPAPSG